MKNNTIEKEPLLMSDAQVAALIGVHRVSFRRWHAAGKTPAEIRVGIGSGSTRWHREEIIAWVAAGCPERKIWDHSKQRKAIRG